MRKKKLIPLATFILIALLIIGASTFYFKAREEKVNQTNVTNDITKEEKKNEEENKEEQSVDDSKVNSNDEVTNSKNDDVSLDTNNSVTNKNTTSNESKKQDVQKEEKNNKKTNDNSSSVSNSQPVQPTQPTQPTCTPKKFDMNWVRADFNTFEECKNIGDKYMDSYGYYCDSYQDSCGTTYYMLTLFDTNGNLFDYHSVQIP